MEFDPSKIASVSCDHNYDPPMVNVTLYGPMPDVGEVNFPISYGAYQYFQTVVPGLPNIVC